MQAKLFILLLLVSAGVKAELFNYSIDEYVKIRGVERCVNKAGWENDQKINDLIIEKLLQRSNISYDLVKLQRDKYWYANKVQSSKKVEMEYSIAEIEQECNQGLNLPKLIVQAERMDKGIDITVAIDELL